MGHRRSSGRLEVHYDDTADANALYKLLEEQWCRFITNAT